MKSPLLFGLVLGFIGLYPLMGGPRYEAALLCGLLGPSWVAAASAVNALRQQRHLRMQTWGDGVRRQLPGARVCLDGVASGTVHLFVALLVAAGHGLRGGFCEPTEGFLLLLLGPGAGLISAGIIGSLTGTMVGMISSRPGGGATALAAFIALSFPLGSIFGGLYHFYDSPAVYAYDPFVGYFAGPLYDTVNYDLPRLLSYRTGTLLTWLGFVALLGSVSFQLEGRRRSVHFVPLGARQILWLALSAACFFGAFVHAGFAESMHLESSAGSIQRDLGRTTTSGRCRIFFSGGVDSRVAQRTADECVGHLAQIEKYFEVEKGGNVDVYLFASAEEKRIYMGAGQTYIAKPWRREIYIQPDGFPHQVLGHELAHVVTGQFGAGPLRIAGLWGGLFPDPGRIEGFAEAAASREHSEGTLHEWTAAMRELKLLPPLKSLFQLSFLQSSAARSYAASGSFVDYVRQTYGPLVLTSWYRAGDLPLLTGKTWPQLEGDWHAFLDSVEVPGDVLEIARPRFSRPGIFQRRCPHAVDRAIEKAQGFCPLQEKKAKNFAEHAIILDPTKEDLRLSMARCGWYAGDPARAQKELVELAQQDTRFEPGARRAAFEFAGDIAWQSQKLDKAKSLYEKSLALTFGRDQKRQLDAKMWGLEQPEEVRRPLRVLLAPGFQEEVLPQVAIARWAQRGPFKHVAFYLLARMAERENAEAQVGELLQELKVEELPLESLRREALRMKLLHSCVNRMRGGSKNAVKDAKEAYEKFGLTTAEQLEAERVTERCETVGLRRTATSKSLSP